MVSTLVKNVLYVFYVYLLLVCNFSLAQNSQNFGSGSQNNCNSCYLSGMYGNNAYDFIVVGAGTAAGPIAYYLAAELPQYTFLFLERGADETNNPIIILGPDITSNTFDNNVAAENYYSLETPSGLNGIPVAVGYAAGGTSAINQEDWVQGNEYLWNLMGQNLGPDFSSKWNWNTALSYMIEIQNFLAVNSSYNASAHGTSGPLLIYQEPIFNQTSWTPIVQAAQTVFDLPLVYDNGAGYNIGIEQVQRSFGHNPLQPVRQYSWSNLFIPSLNYGNVNVILNTTVTNIIMTETQGYGNGYGNYQATGVQYLTRTGLQTACAKKEVILAAGALKTPQLLMLSGIGNCTQLAQFGIPCIINLPGVGKYLQNHLFLYTAWGPVEECSPNPPLYELGIDFPAVNRSLPYPTASLETLNFGDGYFTVNLFDLTTGLNSSQAYLTLASSDPVRQPIVTLNSFPNGCDAESTANLFILFNLTTQWLANTFTCPWIRFVPTYDDLPQSYTTDELIEWICENTGSGFHYAGTAQMGPKANTFSVCDQNLLVYGTNNLRIGDISAISFLPVPHTQTLAYVVGMSLSNTLNDIYG